MNKKVYFPDFIFESSWEVCNKVGGIYTVLSTRAKTLQDVLKDKIIFIGPDFWKDKTNPLFKEDSKLLSAADVPPLGAERPLLQMRRYLFVFQ